MNFKRYNESDNSWFDSHYIMGTDTDTITSLPAVIYPNASTVTVGIKGNTTQSGTPSSQSPVDVNGTGDLSENIYDNSSPVIFYGYYNSGTNQFLGNANNAFISVPIESGKKYYVSGVKRASSSTTVRWCTSSTLPSHGNAVLRTGTFAQTDTLTITAESGENYLALFVCGDSDYSTYGSVPTAMETNCSELVVNRGFKIPISNGQQTTNIYLGSTQTVRQIKKLVLTGEEEWQNNFGTSLFGTLISNATIARISALSTHYTYNPIQSGLNNGLPNGEFALQTSSSPTALYIKDESYTTVETWRAYLAAQYAAGTPVTVWYVLATPETGTVNEPLRKIGDYADTVSGITVPTITGKDTFDVETTLKPSEVSLSYTGWHNAEVKKKSANLFDIEKWLTDRGVSYTIVDGIYEFNTGISLNNNVYYFANDNISVSISGLIEALTATSPYIMLVNKYGGIAKNTALSPSIIKSENILCAGLKFNWNTGGKVRLSNIMLNAGSTALPYEPYWK